MYAYRTPGVYFEWIDNQQPPLLPLRTDIAGFVGIAERGPVHTPVKLESWTQFISIFGRHIPQAYLAYAVQGFFENGGRTCWVVRVANPDHVQSASVALKSNAAKFGDSKTIDMPWSLIAKTPGSWGQQIQASLFRLTPERYSLTLHLMDGTREVWRDLSDLPQQPRYIAKLLNHPQTGSRLVEVRDQRLLTPLWGQDGISGLRPEHFSGENSPAEKPWGLAALAQVDEVSIVALPDLMPKVAIAKPPIKSRPANCAALSAETLPAAADLATQEAPPMFDDEQITALQRSLLTHCELLKDRFAVLDLPNLSAIQQALQHREKLTSKYGALYHSWVKVPDPLELEGPLRAVPPCGHIAGLYARGDLRVGVHKPPANQVLEAVQHVAWPIDEYDYAVLNERSINAIRAYNGRGIRVAGARTLAEDSQWRYINVRRLVTMIEEAIDEQTQWLVFEPNRQELWRAMDRSVRGLLDSLWQRGMLDGASASEAYFVRCDETTNPPEETAVGKVVCLVGVQPPYPAEFVVVRIGKTQGSTEIVELPGGQHA